MDCASFWAAFGSAGADGFLEVREVCCGELACWAAAPVARTNANDSAKKNCLFIIIFCSLRIEIETTDAGLPLTNAAEVGKRGFLESITLRDDTAQVASKEMLVAGPEPRRLSSRPLKHIRTITCDKAVYRH